MSAGKSPQLASILKVGEGAALKSAQALIISPLKITDRVFPFSQAETLILFRFNENDLKPKCVNRSIVVKDNPLSSI